MIKKEIFEKVEFSTPKVDFFDFRVFRDFNHDPMTFSGIFFQIRIRRIGLPIRIAIRPKNDVFRHENRLFSKKIICRINFFENLGQFLKIDHFSLKWLETTYFGVF